MKGFEDYFIQFLLREKEYPERSLAMGISFSSRAFQPDIKIFGEELEFACYFQFLRTDFSKNERTEIASQVLNEPDDNLPFFIIKKENETDFSIHSLTPSGKWKEISKQEFPDYEQMLKLRKIELQKIKETIEQKQQQEIADLKGKSRSTAYFSLLSVLVGLATVIVAYFSSNFQKSKISNETIATIDSLTERIELIEEEITEAKNKKPTVPVDSLFISSRFEERVKQLETTISTDPNRVITIVTLQKDLDILRMRIESFKEEEKAHVDSLNQRFDYLNSWIIGIAITIVGVILSFVLPNLRRNRENAR